MNHFEELGFTLDRGEGGSDRSVSGELSRGRVDEVSNHFSFSLVSLTRIEFVYDSIYCELSQESAGP